MHRDGQDADKVLPGVADVGVGRHVPRTWASQPPSAASIAKVSSSRADTPMSARATWSLLHDKAVDQLIEEGTITSEAVEAAMRAVPRHLFVPEASPEDAYDPFRAFVTKRDADGNALSSVSGMHVQSWMLEHAGIQPGVNVLEVGSGGFNAALLAGPDGHVTTVDYRTPLIFTAGRDTLKHVFYSKSAALYSRLLSRSGRRAA